MKKDIFISKTCKLCNQEFFVKSSVKRETQRQFCKKECAIRFNGLNNKGRKHTEETKKRLKELNTGEKNAFYGKKHLEETKSKIGEKNRRPCSAEKRNKLSEMFSGENNPFYGKKHTEESKAKISQNHADHSGEKNPNYGNGDKLRGDKNPSWFGGISYGEYGQEFSEELKTSIRKRDFFKCKICYEKGYDVHHIDYNKQNNLEENLITLCRSCHAKTNFNRESWKNFFKKMKEENICQSNE